jgi:LytS/YehU family sensor histidine kinase
LQAFGILHKHKLKEQLKQQQLDVLQYQLNPHFLFNSLNSIRGMLYEDVSEAKKLLLEFRQLFKHHFDNKRHCIALKQEILLCRHYLKLEKVRFEERLNVDISVPDACEAMLVPSMSIFTLIENAIKHGIAQIPQGGTIAISVHQQAKKLCISVCNPINLSARQADGTRTGLTNLESRLALLYRDNFTINSERTNDQFRVELQIPIKKDKSGE